MYYMEIYKNRYYSYYSIITTNSDNRYLLIVVKYGLIV